MNKLDTLKLIFPCDGCIDRVDYHAFSFHQIIKSDGNKTQFHRAEPGRLPFGLKEVKVTASSVYLELSAKILQDRYIELINRETVLKTIMACSSDVISFQHERVLKMALVMKADCTLNIALPSAGMKSTLFALQMLRPQAYRPESFKGESVVFRPAHKTSAKYYRQTFYDKVTELKRHKSELAYINPAGFQGTIRYEVNLKHWSQLRLAAGQGRHSGGVSLAELLGYDGSMNALVFQQLLVDRNCQPELFREYSPDTDIKDIIEKEGIKGICRACQLDIALIESFLKLHTNSRPTYQRYKSACIEVLNRLQAEVSLGSSDTTIAELQENLLIAAY